MGKIIEGFLVFIFFIFTSLITTAAEDVDKNVKMLLDLSGITRQIEKYPGLIKSGIEHSRMEGASLPESLYQTILMSVDDSIDTRIMVNGIADELKKHLNEEETQHLLSWYESELGRKISLLEEHSSTQSAYQEMMQITESLLADSDQVKFAKKLDELVGATDFSMRLHENTQIAVLSSIYKALNPHRQLNLEEFKSQMSDQRTRIRANIEQIVIVSFIFTYRNLNQEEIDKYMNFLESQASINFNKSAMSGIDKEMNKALIQLAKSMSILLQSKVQQG